MSRQRVTPEAFLRSINVQLDAEHPKRIDHFQPTSKTVPLVRSLLTGEQDAAFFVVAPYGSGKSITASYVLQLVEGRPDAAETLELVEERLSSVSPELAVSVAERTKRGVHGLTLALHGFNRSVPEAIRRAALESMKRQKLGREARSIERIEAEDAGDVIEVLDTLSNKARDTGRDRIVILWDEFGRHLESLIATGRAADLADLQVLAEYASRATGVPVTLALLLHRDLLQYAGNLPQSVRSEWKKIEGRFQTVQYVDDSREIYRLIGEIVSSRRSARRLPAFAIEATATQAKEVGLFGGMTKMEVVDALRDAYPLEPATLYLLPRLSARVAQNERTLFSFLLSADLERPVGPEALYDYFSGEMRSDNAAGGTYRQWLEAESALTKAEDSVEARTLKTACLLGLGLGGERSRTGRKALELAVAGYETEEDVAAVLDSLVARKLLLYRKHSDQIAVWHGTDFDLRGRLEEEKRRRSAGFDLVRFLERHVAPPVWRPLEYNDRYRLRRYLTGTYRSARQLAKILDEGPSRKLLPVGCDGRIVYGIVTDAGELEELVERIPNDLAEPRLLIALPREPVKLADAALEVHCLLEFQNDRELLGSDPMVEPELLQMLDDARTHLQRLVDRLVMPTPDGTRWFHQFEELEVGDKRSLRRMLTRIMEKVFPETPVINNEMIVKKSPSAVLANARKRLLLGVLEREEQEDFGITGNGPDASMMRTVLVHTGLFRRNREPQWARPEDLDGGLRVVWEEIGAFLSEPSKEPKPVAPLIERLCEPPYGVRAGVLPILFGAALKAFPSARALLRGEVYVEDILADAVEAMFRSPKEHALVVRELRESEREYLEGFHRLFTSGKARGAATADLVRRCFEALEEWKANLPPGALSSKSLSERGQRFQRTVLQTTTNPMILLLETLPEVAGQPVEEPGRLLSELRLLRDELETVEARYRSEARRLLIEALRLGRVEEGSLGEAAQRWGRCFPDVFVEAIPSPVAKGLITRCAMGYSDDKKLLDSLATLLVDKRLDRWQDTTAMEFERRLRGTVHEIEDVATSADATFLRGGEAAEAIADLVEGRIESLYGQLAELAGEERARNVISSLLNLELGRESA